MIKYIITRASNGLLGINTDTLDITKNSATSLNYDYCWEAKEDGVLAHNGKDIPVKAGDLVILTYTPVDFEDSSKGCKVYVISGDSVIKQVISDYKEYRDYDDAKYTKQKNTINQEYSCAPDIACSDCKG